jgi:hypothetical protein
LLLFFRKEESSFFAKKEEKILYAGLPLLSAGAEFHRAFGQICLAGSAEG